VREGVGEEVWLVLSREDEGKKFWGKGGPVGTGSAKKKEKKNVELRSEKKRIGGGKRNEKEQSGTEQRPERESIKRSWGKMTRWIKNDRCGRGSIKILPKKKKKEETWGRGKGKIAWKKKNVGPAAVRTYF